MCSPPTILSNPSTDLLKPSAVATSWLLANPNTLVTFGITPTHAATGYGYLQLGEAIDGHHARVVEQFKEKSLSLKPHNNTTAMGSDKYLWNSGMFVWRASTLLDCIKKYKPANYEGLARIAETWNTDRRDAVFS